MKYYNNGINEKRFDENEKIPDGWYIGRLKSCVTTLNKIWINNGIIQKFIDKDQSIPNGWNIGRLSNPERYGKQKTTMLAKKFHIYNNGKEEIHLASDEEIPNNYVLGRLPISDETRMKQSQSHVGLHHSEETRNKISLHSNNNRDKAKQTSLTRYGVEWVLSVPEIHQAGENTKKMHGTLNTSKPEDKYYIYLSSQYSEVIHHYKCSRYPFYCDFYIPSEDLFIELNLHWTHGGKPYVSTDEECQKQLTFWQEKAKTSKFYENAIYTWTVRDVEKARIAKENNLNYTSLYKL